MLHILTSATIRGDTANSTILSEPVILGIIGLFGAIVTAYLAYLGVKTKVDREQQASDRARMEALEERIDTTERRNVGLWAYCRALIDLVYKLGGVPPDAPHNIKDLFD